jgi:IS5 family transposase
MNSLLELFCDVDDFCQDFLPIWDQHLLASGEKKRQRSRSLTISEIMTILIAFHQSHYRTFKAYYCEQVLRYWRSEFPGLVSYHRFVEYTPSALVPLIVYLRTCCLGLCSGISFVDSTSLDVCLNQRIQSHKVFAGLAERGKTSTGWFFGFKLHLVVNDQGEILSFCITPGNVDDRKPVPYLSKKLFGKLFGDKGYISHPLAQTLRQMFDLQLITKLRSNMKNQLMLWTDRMRLRKRAIIETIIDQLKNISQIEHSRHRSISNFFVNVLCGLIAYSRRPSKPSLGLSNLLTLPA